MKSVRDDCECSKWRQAELGAVNLRSGLEIGNSVLDVKMIRIQSSFAVFRCSGVKLESYYGDVVIATVRLPSYSLSGDYQFSADTPATISTLNRQTSASPPPHNTTRD